MGQKRLKTKKKLFFSFRILFLNASLPRYGMQWEYIVSMERKKGFKVVKMQKHGEEEEEEEERIHPISDPQVESKLGNKIPHNRIYNWNVSDIPFIYI